VESQGKAIQNLLNSISNSVLILKAGLKTEFATKPENWKPISRWTGLFPHAGSRFERVWKHEINLPSFFNSHTFPDISLHQLFLIPINGFLRSDL